MWGWGGDESNQDPLHAGMGLSNDKVNQWSIIMAFCRPLYPVFALEVFSGSWEKQPRGS